MKTIKSHKETVFAICSLQHELKSSLQALIFSFSGISTTHITDYKGYKHRHEFVPEIAKI